MIARKSFESLCDELFSGLTAAEHLVLELHAEDSQFIRINRARVRQIGTVRDALLTLRLFIEGNGGVRQATGAFTLGGDPDSDFERAKEFLELLRRDVPGLPLDEYAKLPENLGSSAQTFTGKLLAPADAVGELMRPMEGLDLTGIYASGSMLRANANSRGQRHWFSTDAFSIDYSLRTRDERAVKETFAGRDWDSRAYAASLAEARDKLGFLEKPAVKLERGHYRTYLAPAALEDLVRMLSWGGVSEASLRQGDSPLRKLREGSATFSPLFSLTEDFTAGDVPRFNTLGELAPEKLPLLQGGKLEGTLISSRTAREYGVKANGAELGEALRAPSVATGTLRSEDILATLGTGLYLSNLHYLNWSDQPGGRITGMTRYACFWVENGKIQGPIENMRFDDSVFHLFGNELEALTDFQSLIPDVSSYMFRELGGGRMPGALLKRMEFTL